MASAARVLVVDDDRTIRDTLVSLLADAGYDAVPADGQYAARARLADAHVDAVLLDIRLRDGDGIVLLEEIRKVRPSLPVIMATSYGDSDRTIRAMKAGAFEYVVKPFDLDALLASVARAVKVRPIARPPSQQADAALVGTSPAMLEVWKAIGRAAASQAPVLITGESGVGKELVARAIHDHGFGPAAPFVPVNLSALPATLLESELFGHEKGAFTGASSRREGRFELAAGGTLFLDEIGDLDPPLQTKLLRVLEDGGFERVGSAERLSSSARLIAATSRVVTPGASSATLREDLFYRLAVVRIEVPPLRERAQDIPLLVDAFLSRAPPPRRAVTEAAMLALTAHDWPGNVRQLRHVLEAARVMSAAEVLDAKDLALDEPARTEAPSTSLDLRSNLERVERELIDKALAVAKGNRAQAARLLGIRRPQLYARMKHLGIASDDGAKD
ncbi:Response regulator of zinc sigma-54-dependent two-component system [Minicystis rosea]|nr:Response regulator of zinc sigma-54-dependent two-component system [Minicystis rosea]